jgi:hypothetical protein
MKLSVIALDYDGTIAVNGQMDQSVRSAQSCRRTRWSW